MRRQVLYGLAGVLVLGGSIVSFSAPQYAKTGAPGSRPQPAATNLEASYHLTLTSTWPRWSGAPVGCADGGIETVEGMPHRIGAGKYSGTFTRRTRLLFCGSHGSGTGSCELTLVGNGKVAMTGVVVPDESSPSGRSARLSWVPGAGHQAMVEGQCAEGFKQAVQQMYLTVRHGAEVPLPAAGAARIKRQLENYAYIAEVE
jgi:hypothetical protein